MRRKPACNEFGQINSTSATLGLTTVQDDLPGADDPWVRTVACAKCGRLSAVAGWCSVCGRVPVPLAAPRPVPVVPMRVSRRQATETTHGTVGRLVWTLLAIGVPVLVLWVDGPLFGGPFIMIYTGTLLPWALRDTWRRARSSNVQGLPPHQ